MCEVDYFKINCVTASDFYILHLSEMFLKLPAYFIKNKKKK